MRFVIFAIFIVGALACNKSPHNLKKEISKTEKEEIGSLRNLSEVEGKKLLKMHCFSCHNTTSESHDNMLAPPLAGIKYKYKEMYPDKIEFVAKMASFIDNPSRENAIMKGPVRRFGLMPKSVLSRSQILEISAFIYDEKLDVPDWFPEHFEEGHNKKWTQ